MKKIVASIVVVVAMVLGMGGVVASQTLPAVAESGANKAQNYFTQVSADNSTDLLGNIETILNVVIGVLFVVCVGVVILGGVQYTSSQGVPDKVTKAKNTIMYGIIGLVIATLAFAIVQFVLKQVFNQS